MAQHANGQFFIRAPLSTHNTQCCALTACTPIGVILSKELKGVSMRGLWWVRGLYIHRTSALKPGSATFFFFFLEFKQPLEEIAGQGGNGRRFKSCLLQEKIMNSPLLWCLEV